MVGWYGRNLIRFLFRFCQTCLMGEPVLIKLNFSCQTAPPMKSLQCAYSQGAPLRKYGIKKWCLEMSQFYLRNGASHKMRGLLNSTCMLAHCTSCNSTQSPSYPHHRSFGGSKHGWLPHHHRPDSTWARAASKDSMLRAKFSLQESRNSLFPRRNSPFFRKLLRLI